MLTLHDIIEQIKRVLKWGGILVATVLTVFFIFKIGFFVKEIFYPTPKPGPEVCFGKLQKIAFPNNAVSRKLEYKIETISGILQSFQDDRLKVYEIVQPVPSLRDLDKAQEKLSRLGFISKPIPVSGTVYQWEDKSSPTKKINYDILTLNFNIFSDFATNPEILTANNLPDQDAAVSITKSYLTDLNSLPENLDFNKTKVTLQSIENGGIISAGKLPEAKLIRVDLYQNDIDKLPVFYPHPPFSNIHLLISGGENGAQIVEGSFSNSNLGGKSCTYPIKTVDQVFKELQNGKAYIGFYSGTGNTVLIKNAFLAYYMDETLQKYLMPIIVFTGEDEFYGYVPAITDGWIND